jgi:lysophospholipase L1-like esterase
MSSIRMKFAAVGSGLAMLVAAIVPLQTAVAEPGCPSSRPDIGACMCAGFSMATGMQCGGQPAAGTATVPGSDQDSAGDSAATGTNGMYVALGDSVAAGIGLDGAATDPVCGVSGGGYPTYVASGTDTSYVNLACSGATAGDLFTEQHLPGTAQDVAAQIPRAFAAGTPSLITITAGANDIYWPYFVRKCYTSTCGTATDSALAAGLTAVLRAKLAYALYDIAARSGDTPPPVVLTGYYQPFSDACTQQAAGLTADEINWITTQTANLNQVLAQAAAAHSFVHFAPVNFAGHELCTADPWIQGPSDPAPLHPTVAGQQAIAQAVLTQL